MSSFDTLLEGPDIHADFPQLTSPRLVALKRPWAGRLPTDVAQQGPATASLNTRLRGSRAAGKNEGEEPKGVRMKSVTLIGALLVVLGLVSFVVPIPHREDHGLQIGDAKIGVQTEHSE